MSYMGGIRRGGGGQIPIVPHARMVEGGMIVNNLIWKISYHLFGGMKRDHYLCIDNVREMSGWGRDTSWSVDSHVRGRLEHSDLLIYYIQA